MLTFDKCSCIVVQVIFAILFGSLTTFADTYTLTGRVASTDTGVNGLPAGKSLSNLLSTDILVVTNPDAQIWIDNNCPDPYAISCNIEIAGDGYGNEKTGKIRIQSTGVVNLNGVITLTGDTYIGSHANDAGTLYFNNQITGNGALVITTGTGRNVYLNSTSNPNNYTGNTLIGTTNNMYRNVKSGNLILAADEQIPNGAGKGDLILYNSSKLDLNGHTETVNGLTSSSANAVITGSGKLIVGDNDATSTYSGTITGDMELGKIGSGTLYIDRGFGGFDGNMSINNGKISFLINRQHTTLNAKKLSGSGVLELRIGGGSGTGGRDYLLPNIENDNFTGVISLVCADPTSEGKITTNGNPCTDLTFVVNDGTTLFIGMLQGQPAGLPFKGKVLVSGQGNAEPYGALRVNEDTACAVTIMSDADVSFTRGIEHSGTIDSGANNGEVTMRLIRGYRPTSETLGTLSGTISDGETGSILGVNVSTGVYKFSGDVSYSGATNIDSSATLQLSGANANLKKSRAVTIDGTLNFDDYTGDDAMKVNNLSGTDGKIIGTDKDLILNNNQMSAFIGSITAKDIEKTGDETLTIVAEASSGGIRAESFVISSGRINLQGYLEGVMELNDNTTLSPGASIGRLDVDDNFVLGEFAHGGEFIPNENAATLLMEIGGSDIDDNDFLTISGELTLNNGLVYLELAQNSKLLPGENFTMVLDAENSADLPADFIENYVRSYYFTDLEYILLTDGAYSGMYAITGRRYTLNEIPEPSTWALLILGAAGLFLVRRRAKKL